MALLQGEGTAHLGGGDKVGKQKISATAHLIIVAIFPGKKYRNTEKAPRIPNIPSSENSSWEMMQYFRLAQDSVAWCAWLGRLAGQ